MALAARYPPLSLDEQNLQIRLLDEQAMAVEPHTLGAGEESNSICKVELPTPEKGSEPAPQQVDPTKEKGRKKQEKPIVNWDELRKQYSHGMSRERTEQNADSVNWEAIRQASAAELAKVIVDRGMSNQLAGRIKVLL